MPLLNFNKTVPYIKKKGIFGFLLLIFYNFFDLILLNLVFTLTSLPVFTIGASLTALNKMTLRMVQDEPTSFVKEYFHYFKVYFKDGVISGIIFSLAIFLTGFSFFYYFGYASQMPVLYVAAFLAAVCFILIMFVATFYFPMLAEVDLKKTVLLKNSFILCISCFKRTILAFLLYFILAAIIFAFFPYSLIAIPILPISWSALAACCAAWEPIKSNAVISDENITEDE